MRVELTETWQRQKETIETLVHVQTNEGGMRLLKHTMASIFKGEVGLRVRIWRTAQKDSEYDQGLDYLERELAVQAKRLEKRLG